MAKARRRDSRVWRVYVLDHQGRYAGAPTDFEFEEVRHEDGIRRCGIVLAPELIPVAPRQMRPFQGWRYFEQRDVPPDLTDVSGDIDPAMPPEMLAELRELGLV